MMYIRRSLQQIKPLAVGVLEDETALGSNPNQ